MKDNKIYDPTEHEVFHDTDPAVIKKRLDGFYGKVARIQDQKIEKRIFGKKVLDVGCGYGYLLNYLQERKFDCIGIEPAPKEIEYAKKWWGIDVIEGSIYQTAFSDSEFDTVILRDVIFHLDLEEALNEIKRINRKRVIVFMGNTGWLLKLTKWALRHKEHNMKDVKGYESMFKEKGYDCVGTEYTDFFAFPLSGGYISKPLVPNRPFFHKMVLVVENRIEKILGFLRLKEFFAFRVLLVFDKK